MTCKLKILTSLYLLLTAGFVCITVFCSQPLSFIALWPASNYFWLFLAYLINPDYGVILFQKSRKTGQFNPLLFIYFLPFFIFIWSTWAIKHIIAGEHPYDLCYTTASGKNMWIGRYPVFGVPEECDIIVDCTVEFPGRRIDGDYMNVPSLDMVLAPPQEFRDAAEKVIKLFEDGRKSAFIHCANGHGRSALLAALVIVLLKEQDNLADCRKILKEKRSVINWQTNQEEIVAKAIELKPAANTKIELVDVDSAENEIRTVA